jgi:Proteasome stabiliser
MQNRTVGPYVAAVHRNLVAVMPGWRRWDRLAVKHRLLKWNDAGFSLLLQVRKLFRLFLGTTDAGVADDARVTPASAALKLRLLGLLSKSAAAANSFPDTLRASWLTPDLVAMLRSCLILLCPQCPLRRGWPAKLRWMRPEPDVHAIRQGFAGFRQQSCVATSGRFRLHLRREDDAPPKAAGHGVCCMDLQACIRCGAEANGARHPPGSPPPPFLRCA